MIGPGDRFDLDSRFHRPECGYSFRPALKGHVRFNFLRAERNQGWNLNAAQKLQVIVALVGAIFLHVARGRDNHGQRKLHIEQSPGVSLFDKLCRPRKGFGERSCLRAGHELCIRKLRRRNRNQSRNFGMRLLGHGINCFDCPQAVADEQDPCMAFGKQEIEPGADIVATIVNRFVSGA